MAPSAGYPSVTPEDRARLVDDVIHSGEMEGLSVSPVTRADMNAYAEGAVDVDELVARTRARYGLA